MGFLGLFPDPLRDSFFFESLVHEPLAFGPFDRQHPALRIRHLAVGPAERELVAVAVDVLLRKLVERPVVSPLQEGDKAFRRVGMNDQILHGGRILSTDV